MATSSTSGEACARARHSELRLTVTRQHKGRGVTDRLSLKEMRTMFDALRDENFELRLRVNYLEERTRALSADVPPDVDAGLTRYALSSHPPLRCRRLLIFSTMLISCATLRCKMRRRTTTYTALERNVELKTRVATLESELVRLLLLLDSLHTDETPNRSGVGGEQCSVDQSTRSSCNART